ncbi:MAG TPA: recombinase family protein [Propionibacteriaceae bacterium]|nr:recombinase family protein [Propionibacteriaceae bacterium]
MQVIEAGAYLRISLDWAGKELGVTRQREDCQRIADRLGWKICDWYIDNNKGASRRSRSKSRRDEYQRLLADIEAGLVKAVIIWMEDRLHRQVIELAEFLKVCEAAGVTRIASVGGELDLSDPDQRTMLYIKAAMAEAEVEKLSLRRKRQEQQAAEQGRRARGGIRPMGEVWHGKQQVSEERAAHERELIREAVRRLIAGDSLRGIVVDWLRRGEQTPAGGKWHNVNLRRMLLSPRLIGVRLHHGRLFPGTWEPIISVEDYEAVKAILEDPARYKYERGGLPKHLLSGMTLCGLCGNKLSVRKRYNNRIYYCSQNPPSGGCGKIQRVADKLEGLITEAIFVAVESDTLTRTSEESDDPVAPLYQELARLQGVYDRLEDKVAREVIKESTAKRQRFILDHEMEMVRRDVDRHRGGQVIGLVPRNLRDVWPDLSLDRRRNIMKAILVRVKINPQPNAVVFDPGAIVAEWRV